MSDVLVVGGGVVGLFCAYFLRQAGASVAVVERATVGDRRSCSYGNTGFVGTQGAAPMAEPDVLVPHPDRELVSWLRHFRQARNDRDAAETYRVLLDLKKRGLEILRELCASGGLASTFTADGLLLVYRTPEGFEDACRSVPAAVSLGVPLR
ncbi:MAG TPA: FAD-dependent oxidoreductase, partial [Micromonosporaceae bacterium]|nr:FAD-dependent oxidoreductase [Micromonosporaceae bacterium]